MASYKLHYFDFTGLGEPIRYMLHYGGIEFEDIRYNFQEWPRYKKEMPMEQVPVLEVNGIKYPQCKSLCRYLGKQFDLYGSNDIEALEIDSVVDSIDDLRGLIASFYWQEDVKYKILLKETATIKLPVFLDKFENRVKENGGYLVNGKLSFADIFYAAISEYLSNILARDLNRCHPSLQKLVERIREIPNIKAYISINGLKKLQATYKSIACVILKLALYPTNILFKQTINNILIANYTSFVE